ncbi:unnamed protein product, partial [Rotaria sp. Silwood2]
NCISISVSNKISLTVNATFSQCGSSTAVGIVANGADDGGGGGCCLPND